MTNRVAFLCSLLSQPLVGGCSFIFRHYYNSIKIYKKQLFIKVILPDQEKYGILGICKIKAGIFNPAESERHVNLSRSYSAKARKRTPSRLYLLWAMISIELLMSFSSLGYIHIDPISLTFAYIPVLLTGCLMGPREAAAVGAVFGLASMWKASAFYVGAGDAVFSPFMSGKPLASLILSVGTRTLFGFITGLLYQGAKKSRHPVAGILAVSTVGRVIHTFLVYTCMGLFFPESGRNAASTLNDIRRWDFLLFAVIVDVLAVLCYLFQQSDQARDLKHRIETVDHLHSLVMQHKKRMSGLIALLVFAIGSVAVYFTNRIGQVMSWYGIHLTEETSYDLVHLQIQFFLGIISLVFLVLLVISLYQKNYNCLYYEARLDGLTGIPGRSLFFQMGEQMLTNMNFSGHSKMAGCFIILDLDDFKEINDCFGHPAGDQVLKAVADQLKNLFDANGILGRLGGDEFVALIHEPLSRTELEQKIESLKEHLHQLQTRQEKVTCSIGVIPIEKQYSIDELYRSADRLLYEAKKKGKNQSVFGYRFEDHEQ